MVKDSEEELKKEFLKLNKSLTDRAVDAVRSYAKANNIDLIIEKSEKVKGPVLFGNPGVDVTDAIIKAMNG